MDRLFDFMEKHGAKLAVVYLISWVVFWAGVIIVALHFIAKWW
jgi:hypothetical protein